MTTDQKLASVLARLEALEKENAELKQAQHQRALNMRVSDSGYIEVYGLPGKGRFSLSLPPDGWDKLFTEETKATILKFVDDNRKMAQAKIAAYQAKRAG